MATCLLAVLDDTMLLDNLMVLTIKLRFIDSVPLFDASLPEEKATDKKLGTPGQAASIEEEVES